MPEKTAIPSEPSTATPAAVNNTLLTQEPLQQDMYKEALQRLPIQRKLSIGAVDDPLELEADSIADQVMRMPEIPFIQRKCAHCEEEERQNIQAKPIVSGITPFIQRKSEGEAVAGESVTNQINATKGGGNSLPDTTKSFMENRFGTDFSSVRLHTDNSAVQMSKELNAQAFTVGNNIYFNEGKYNPGSDSGKHLLAHELTHTIQQGNGVHRQIQRLGPPFGPGVSGPANWAADVSAATTSAQKTALIQTVTGTSVTVNDATAASVSDPLPDPAHLRPFTIASPVINFDQNLITKHARVGGRALTINAGYTFQHGTSYYVVIADAALVGANYNQTVQTINHEFDHINQYLRGSPLTGNASELDAWTSTFVREFHHSYHFRPTDSGTTCYVELDSIFAPLLMYYQQVTNATQRSNVVSSISAYYTATISPNAANTHAFRYWVYRSMKSTSNPDLGTAVNTALSLGIVSSSGSTVYRGIPCTNVPATSLPGSSTLVMPTAPASGSKGPESKP